MPDRVIHLWNLQEGNDADPDIENVGKYLDLGFYSLLYLVRALDKENGDAEVHIAVLTRGMQQVLDEPARQPVQAAVLGPVDIIPREFPTIKCGCIDIQLTGERQENWLVNRLLNEFNAGISERLIAYRSGRRMVRSFEPVAVTEPGPDAPRLREGGVYWITGGTGGIGLVLARHLAKAVGARLVLTARSPLPAREEWDRWLDTHAVDDTTAEKIRNIKEIESMGAGVLVAAVDVTDPAGMEGVVKQALERFGSLNGVIHAAGIPGGGMIGLKTRDMADSVLAAKVTGTLVLNQVLQGIDTDFVVFCSSINAVLPVFGQVDYSAANAFLDAFAFYRGASVGNTVSINWDSWQEVGMAAAAAPRFAAPSSAGSIVQPEVHLLEMTRPHPLLDKLEEEIVRGAGEYVYTSRFRLDRQWVLSGHTTRDEKGLAPGVTYLEMALAAFRDRRGPGSVEIRDVHFLKPLMVTGDEEKNVCLTLKPGSDESRFEFLVKSRSTEVEGEWRNHAAGEVLAAAAPDRVEKIHDIAEIRARCPRVIGKDELVRLREEKSSQSLIRFGPRWFNTREVRYGDNEGLLLLELPDAFAAEADTYGLHPALLDNAAAFLYGYIEPDTPYIPFSYKRLTVGDSVMLPARLWSYSRLIENETGDRRDYLEFNVTLMDEQGRELVDIEGFTMLRVSQDIAERIREKEGPAEMKAGVGNGDITPGHEAREPVTVKNGIAPDEGVEVFTRILGMDDMLPQVTVSTVDLRLRLEKMLKPAAQALADNLEDAAIPGPTHARPDISSPYAAPAGAAEQKLAALWQELLGIEQVGVEDDFFELGGDSLKANMMIARIKKQFNAVFSIREVFNTPRVRDLAKALDKIVDTDSEGARDDIPPAEKKEYYPLSPIQERLYILNAIEGIDTAYNLPAAFIVEGELDRRELERTLARLVQRHESLRVLFTMAGAEPVQVVRETVEMPLQYWEVNDNELEGLIRRFIQPFDISEAPLMRMGLARLGEQKHALLIDMHHIISDGTSHINMVREFTALYRGRELPELKLQYSDFSQWLNSEPGKAALEKQEKFWLDQFGGGNVPVLDIYTDYPRTAVQNFDGDRIAFTLDSAAASSVHHLVKDTGTTLFMVLLSVFTVVLSKFSGQEDIVVGTPVAGRQHADLQEIIGLFINTLPMRNYPAAGKSFAEFLSEVKENTLAAFENQGYPFGDLIKKLDLMRDISRNPLYDAELIVQNMDIAALEIEGLRFTKYPFGLTATQLDIILEVIEANGEMSFELSYCTKLFKRETMEKFAGFFKDTLATVIENRRIKLGDIKISLELNEAAPTAVGAEDIQFGF
jgi:NAD(P)-dependent dehydrogenase (short-subunit alcohol dehydrogenase family)/acyl carrier protein